MNLFKKLVKTWILPPGMLWFLRKCAENVRLMITLRAEDRRLLLETRLLKGRHRGARCFVLGAGSSITGQDIARLKGELVVSVSNTFVHPDFARIKPRYHVTPPLIRSHGGIYSEQNFVSWLKAMEAATGTAEMFFHIGDREMIERNGLFGNRIIHWVEYTGRDEDFDTRIDLTHIPDIWSVSELALTVAVYLGFEKIYLIGIDHDWFNGPLVYFYDHAKEHELKPNAERLSFADSEFQMRRHAEIFKKYKGLYSVSKNIYNANSNPAHYLDVFPKVDFDTLFTAKTDQR